MASPLQWTWVWINSGSWWWTGRSGVLLSMGSQRVGHNWVTELNWSKPCFTSLIIFVFHKTQNPSLIIRQSQKSSSWETYKIFGQWVSPGSLVVSSPGCHAVAQAQSMVQELRSHKLCNTTKKKKILEKNLASIRNCHNQGMMTKCNVISWVECCNRKRTLDKNKGNLNEERILINNNVSILVH